MRDQYEKLTAVGALAGYARPSKREQLKALLDKYPVMCRSELEEKILEIMEG